MAFWSDGLRRRHFTAAGAALPARVRRGENPPRLEVRAHSRPDEQCVSCLDRPAIRGFRSVRSLEGFERPLRHRVVVLRCGQATAASVWNATFRCRITPSADPAYTTEPLPKNNNFVLDCTAPVLTCSPKNRYRSGNDSEPSPWTSPSRPGSSKRSSTPSARSTQPAAHEWRGRSRCASLF